MNNYELKLMLLGEIGFNKTEAQAIVDTCDVSVSDLAEKVKQLYLLKQDRLGQILGNLDGIEENTGLNKELFSNDCILRLQKQIKSEIRSYKTDISAGYGKEVTDLLKQLAKMCKEGLPYACCVECVDQLRNWGFAANCRYKPGYGDKIPVEYKIADKIAGRGTGEFFFSVFEWTFFHRECAERLNKFLKSSPKEALKYKVMAKVVRTLVDKGAVSEKTAVEFNPYENFSQFVVDEMIKQRLLVVIFSDTKKSYSQYRRTEDYIKQCRSSAKKKCYIMLDDVHFDY